MKSKYPKDWKAIRAEVLARAGNCCEWDGCGVANHAMIEWNVKGWMRLTAGEVDANTADGIKSVYIVLTIAHLDQDPTNNGEPGNRPNLKALCQRHHNRLDAPHRAAGIKRRRHEKAGQIDAFTA
jgi:hypothetical protein